MLPNGALCSTFMLLLRTHHCARGRPGSGPACQAFDEVTLHSETQPGRLGNANGSAARYFHLGLDDIFCPISLAGRDVSGQSETRLRRLKTDDEARVCMGLQQRVWGSSELEVVPHHMFVVAHRTGGQTDGSSLFAISSFESHPACSSLLLLFFARPPSHNRSRQARQLRNRLPPIRKSLEKSPIMNSPPTTSNPSSTVSCRCN